MLDKMAVRPPAVIPELNTFLATGGRFDSTSGAASTPAPALKVRAIIIIARLSSVDDDNIFIPPAVIVPNMIIVAPPRTGGGTKEKTAPTTGNKPVIIRSAAI